MLVYMRYLLPLLIAFAATGCGSDPLEPSDDAPTVSLSILVYGHISQRPIVGEMVALVTNDTIWTPGGARFVLLPKRTDGQGRVTWHVPPGHVYPVQVRGFVRFESVVVVNDSQWLLSLPE